MTMWKRIATFSKKEYVLYQDNAPAYKSLAAVAKIQLKFYLYIHCQIYLQTAQTNFLFRSGTFHPTLVSRITKIGVSIIFFVLR